MGTRGDNSKQLHDRRNQELIKRLTSDSTFSSKGVGGVTPVMSKSLTMENRKGQLDHVPPSISKTRTRRKADVEKALQSLQRQTSSSAMKMSLSLNDKDQFVDNRKVRESSPARRKSLVKDPLKMINKKRESVNGRSINPVGHGNDKKGINSGSAGEHIKRSDVFERLSRQDCNKGVTKLEQGSGNRIRDRSPGKNGRRSPQDVKTSSDKNVRKSSNSTMKSSQNRKRDSSPTKIEENVRKTGSAQGLIGRKKVTREIIRRGNSDPGEDKDGSREKLEKDNVPEAPDKDLKDSSVIDDVDRILITASGLVTGKDISSTSLRQGVGGADGVDGGECKVVQKPLLSTDKVKQGHPASQNSSLGGMVTQTNNAVSSHVTGRERKLADKASVTSSKPSTVTQTDQSRSSIHRKTDTIPRELSKAEVMEKVRQRVCDDNGKDDKNVVDDDKDVCEGEKCDDNEFYKIKVQTRLVSYNNSTLVIKNTSKVDGAIDNATQQQIVEDSDDELCDSHPPPSPPLPPHTLQTSSMALTPSVAPSDDVEVNDTHALPTETHQGGDTSSTSSPFTRSRSMRDKFSHFVSKGKNFLSDVYTATQNKIEHYTKGDSPSTSVCSSISSSIVSLDDEKISRTRAPHTSDSGYFSITTSPEVTRPVTRENSPEGGACLQNDTPENDINIDPKSQKILLTADGRVDTQDFGTKYRGNATCPGATEGNLEYAKSIDQNGTDDDVDEVDCLPAIPPPHKNFTLNEEWIKKHILCTCKCNKNKTVKQSAKPALACEENQSTLSNSDETGVDSEGVIDSEDCPDLDSLCLCSCHDGEEGQIQQQFPKEVLDILDADHARMWWTITGNFGSILPIDWSKTYTRQQYLPVLNLNETKEATNTTEENEKSAEDDAEEEEVAQDLDLHHLILNGLGAEPVKSAEEVIREIDDIMQEGSSSEDEGAEETSASGTNSNESPTHPLPPPLYAEKLNNMSIGELNEAYMELEIVIRQYSETLINQLALRDELEYEKELKNSFISLLLQVQNKRRNFNVEKKKQKKVGPNGIDPKYLTTVIPYDVGHGPPGNETLQILIKILMAINEDSPTVPTLLTDYILKVLCPS